jgi:hypothetical protein
MEFLVGPVIEKFVINGVYKFYAENVKIPGGSTLG